ncbi:MAG TPA: TRAP transporter small permease [Desulfotignum sp.]|jgi:TRAP-type mannitol/chloroaromatic compound transport system permease small subunit|nr:TRAP transporter small permease [Desulfotignum sp.]
MRKLEQSIAFVGGMNRRLGMISSFVLVLIMLFLCYEVLMRYFFNSPTIWVHELSGFSFAFYLALTGPWLLQRKEHVSVDIVYTRFPQRFKLFADIIAYLVCLAFFVVLFWVGGKDMLHSFKINQHSYTVWGPPLGPVKFFVPLAAALFILQSVAGICETVLNFKKESAK